MPNVSVFVPASKMPDKVALDVFTDACTELCTGVLKAALDKVHIIFIPVLSEGRGQDAYVEVKYRLEAFRPPEVMKDFIGRLDAVVKERFSLTARIRCFGYAADAIYAIN
jgi:hypothetical protein